MRMRTYLGAVALSALALAACSEDVTGPVPHDSTEEVAAESWPLVDGDVFEREDGYPKGGSHQKYHGSLSSRYVLQDDGRFRLQYLSARHGFFEYLGSYTLETRSVVLAFDASNTAGQWIATGTLQGECMTVEYNTVMMLADFLDGKHCRTGGT